MNLITMIVGGFFRRWWGGWGDSRHWVDILIAFSLGTISGFLHTGNLFAAPVYGLVICLAFLNTFHGEGMGMGFSDHDKEIGRKTWMCALIMGGSYGAYTLLAAGLVYWITGNFLYGMAFNGFLTPIPYYFAWKFKDKIPAIQLLGRPFIKNGEACDIGELFLGALLLG